MKHLFETDNKEKLTIAPQVRHIKEFTELQETREHEVFMRELSTIYFFADMRSPYYKFTEDERMQEIRKDILYKYPDWEPDEYFDAAVKKYKELSFTTSMLSLQAAEKGINAFRKYLENVDLNERNDKGALVHNPTTIKGMLKDLPTLMKAYQELEMIVKSDINENNMLQAGREKSPFEDPDDNMG